jgi:hypothetical protein
MPQLVLQLKEGLENGLSYDFVFLSIFLLGKFLLCSCNSWFTFGLYCLSTTF